MAATLVFFGARIGSGTNMSADKAAFDRVFDALERSYGKGIFTPRMNGKIDVDLNPVENSFHLKISVDLPHANIAEFNQAVIRELNRAGLKTRAGHVALIGTSNIIREVLGEVKTTRTREDSPRPPGQTERAPVLRVCVVSMNGRVSKVGNKYRFKIRVEGDNKSSQPTGWSGVTINVPTISSHEQYLSTEIQMTTLGCNTPSQYGPGDEIWGFLDDGSFGKKAATCLLMESVREQWPPHERIALEAVLLTSCRRLDLHVRVWSTHPDTRDGFGDPDWKATTLKDQQGISAYPLSLRFGVLDGLKDWFRRRSAGDRKAYAKPESVQHKPFGTEVSQPAQPSRTAATRREAGPAASGGWVVRCKEGNRYVYMNFYAARAEAADQLRALLSAQTPEAMMAALAALSDPAGVSARALDDPKGASVMIEDTARELAVSLGMDNKKRDDQEAILKTMCGSEFLAPNAVASARTLAKLFRELSIAGETQLRTAEEVPLDKASRDEKPHRNAEYAYVCATSSSAPTRMERLKYNVREFVKGLLIFPESSSQALERRIEALQARRKLIDPNGSMEDLEERARIDDEIGKERESLARCWEMDAIGSTTSQIVELKSGVLENVEDQLSRMEKQQEKAPPAEKEALSARKIKLRQKKAELEKQIADHLIRLGAQRSPAHNYQLASLKHAQVMADFSLSDNQRRKLYDESIRHLQDAIAKTPGSMPEAVDVRNRLKEFRDKLINGRETELAIGHLLASFKIPLKNSQD